MPMMSSLAVFVLSLYLCGVRIHGQATCEQGVNCMLPDCYCGDSGIPAKINPKHVPQMVVIALDGHLDNTRDKHYEKLLPQYLRNPHGCQSSATMFVPGKGTDFKLVKKWHKRGIEIALNSEHGSPTYDYWFNIKREDMKQEVLKPLNKVIKEAEIKRKSIFGYRNPAFFAAGNVQYQVLEYEGFQYDATLRVNRRSIYEDGLWPSTLDFPFGYRCVIGKCPQNSYPGLWVVPSVTLFNGTETGGHVNNRFPYATGFDARTKDEMSDFLWSNFEPFYESSRTPFVVNMNTVAFLGPNGSEKLKGFQAFIQRLLEKPDVFLISMHQLIEWMKDPTPLQQIHKFRPWSCQENNADYKGTIRQGTPIKVKDLKRKSKVQVLYGRNSSSRSCSSSFLAIFIMLLQILWIC